MGVTKRGAASGWDTPLAVVCVMLAAACGSSEGSGPGSDAGMDAPEEEGAADVARCTAPTALGPAGRSGEGVLTNHPTFTFAKTGGTLDITTAYFDMLTAPGFTSLSIWGDVKNGTARQQCVPQGERFDIGTQALVAVVDGPAYELEGSIVSVVCLDPGASAVFRSSENNVDPTLLDAPITISYSFATVPPSVPNRRHPDDPQVLTAAVSQGESGWSLRGQMKAGPDEINTLETRVYIRDSNGLLYKLFRAFPGDLHTIPARSVFDFETEANASEFCSYELFNLFIVGPEPPTMDGGSSDAFDAPPGD
jgi:hypothetical protein